MALIEGEEIDVLLSGQNHLWKHLLNFINSMSLKCAIQLGIPDIIHHHGRPITLLELVSALSFPSSKTECVHRLLRMLVHSGFIDKQKNGDKEDQYSLTPSSKLLVKENPMNLSPLVLLILDPFIVTPFHFLSTWFSKTEPTPFEMVHGASVWELARQNIKLNNFFNDGMASDSGFLMSIAVKECGEVFDGLTTVVDVGGGTGTAAKAIAEAFPHVKCTIFDLPHVVATLPKNIMINSIGGDMFESIPSTDAIFLKWILHDWSDKDCVKILKQCKKAISSSDGGKVIIMDIVMNNNVKDQELSGTQICFDMLMMGVCGGKERNEEEWFKIFLDAGFTRYKIRAVLGVRSIIEVYP